MNPFTSILASVRSRLARLTLGGWLTLGVIGLAIAGNSYTDFLRAIADMESRMRPGIVNSYGYVGLFQMGTAALTDAGYYKANGTAVNSWSGTFTGKNGLTSLAQFKTSPDLQVQAITDYYNKLQSYINYFGLNKYVGQTLNGVPITASGLIAGAHLVGIGALKSYLDSGGTVIPKDGNGVAVTTYMTNFGGYTLSSTAPTYAALLGASPTAGVTPVPTPPPTSTSPAPVFPSVATDKMNPDDAFVATTGYTMWQVADMFKQLFAAVLFVWAAVLMIGSLRKFKAGEVTIPEIAHDKLRALVVLSAFLFMLF